MEIQNPTGTRSNENVPPPTGNIKKKIKKSPSTENKKCINSSEQPIMAKKRKNQVVDNVVKKKYRKPKPYLSPKQLTDRFKFAEEHLTWSEEWGTVIFSGQKTFKLDGPDCHTCVWYKLPKNIKPSKNSDENAVYIWGAFCNGKQLPIYLFRKEPTPDVYLDTLQCLVPFIEMEKKEKKMCIFQDNPSAKCVNKQTQSWLKKLQIPVINWPRHGSDFNPIENLFEILAAKVYENERKFQTLSELEDCIRKCWEETDTSFFADISMKDRMADLIIHNGHFHDSLDETMV